MTRSKTKYYISLKTCEKKLKMYLPFQNSTGDRQHFERNISSVPTIFVFQSSSIKYLYFWFALECRGSIVLLDSSNTGCSNIGSGLVSKALFINIHTS